MPVKETVFGDGIQWIDITEPTREELEKIKEAYDINHYLLHDCLDPTHLPKYDVAKNIHFLIVRYYNHTIDKRIATIQELTSKVALFYTDAVVISIHRENPHFMREIKQKCIDENAVITRHDLVAKILWHALHSFEDPGLRLSEQVDFYESRIFLKDTDPSQLEALYFIKQKATLCQRLLATTGNLLNQIKQAPDDDAALDDVKDQHLKVMTLYTNVLDDVAALKNIYISLSAQKTNDVMKVLTVFSVFFLPLTFIAGVYGMNFDYMPELGQKWGYGAVWLLMVVIVAVIFFWVKRKRWL